MKNNIQTPETNRLQDLLESDAEIKELWDLAGSAESVHEISSAEIEESLKQLFGSIGITAGSVPSGIGSVPSGIERSETETSVKSTPNKVTSTSTKAASNRTTSKKLSPVYQRKNTAESNTARQIRVRRPFVALLMAAMVLMTAGIGYLLIPVKTIVPNGETALVSLPDKSTVELNSGSTLQYKRLFGITHRSVELTGEGYFNVVKGSLPFRIKSNQVVTEVLGTTFNLRSYGNDGISGSVRDQDSSERTEPKPEEINNQENTLRNHTLKEITEITVTSGEVSMQAGDQALVLRGGETGVWDPQSHVLNGPHTGSITHALAWRNDAVAFHEMSLAGIFMALERRFDVQITWSDHLTRQINDPAGNSMTAYYSPPVNLERILNDIATVKSLHFERLAGRYHFSDGSRPGKE